MQQYEIDGMIVDDIFYWWDQPVVYLGRIVGEDDRPCLVLLVDDQNGQIYHRMRFEDERGMRATLACGCSPTPDTYALATDVARLHDLTGEETWEPTTYEALLQRGEKGTDLPPSRSNGHVGVERWGVDHWTVLLYLEARAVASTETPTLMEYARMRVNGRHHLVQHDARGWLGTIEEWTEKYGTRLAGYDDDPTLTETPKLAVDNKLQIGYHDDVDCIEEIEAEEMIRIVSTAKGTFEITDAGLAAAARVRAYKAKGGSLSKFRWETGGPDTNGDDA